MSGSERIPSSFVLRIAEALAGRRVDYGGIESLPWHRRVALSEFAPANRDDALDAAEYDLSSAELAARGGGSLGYLSNEFTVLMRAARADEQRCGFARLTAFDGYIGPTDPQTRLLSQEPVSPTRLEEYARCPFRYFVRHVLRVVELEDPAELERISPLERGSLAHRVLEQFFREQKARGRLPLSANDRDDLQAELRRIFALHSAAVERRGAVGYPLFWRIDRETLLEDLIAAVRWEIEQAGDLVPDDFEVRFGGDGSVAFELDTGWSILFKGRIDRVDVSSDRKRARVIDYKTGKTSYRDNAFAGGRCLQLPVYLLAARAISGNSLETLEAEYRKVSPHQAKPAVFSGEALLAREDEFRAILSAIASGIAEGLFPPWPVDTNDCRWCSCARICGANTGGRVRWKAENDARTEALRAMRGIEDD